MMPCSAVVVAPLQITGESTPDARITRLAMKLATLDARAPAFVVAIETLVDRSYDAMVIKGGAR
jgi:hypothetical protein